MDKHEQFTGRVETPFVFPFAATADEIHTLYTMSDRLRQFFCKRVSATNELSAEDARKLADTIEFIAPHVVFDKNVEGEYAIGYKNAELLRAYAEALNVT